MSVIEATTRDIELISISVSRRKAVQNASYIGF